MIFTVVFQSASSTLVLGSGFLCCVEGVEKVPPRMPPELGEHSTEVLREAGYGDAEIDELLASGVVMQGKSS